MKLLFAFFFLCLSSVHGDLESDEFWANLDMSTVIPVEDVPGFWDGRDPSISPSGEEHKRVGRIVGGQEAVPGAHPYMAAILMRHVDRTTICGGSIVGVRTILTAAHCPINSIETQVILGAHNRRVNEPTQHRQVVPNANYRIHANYNPSNLNNDIATLILNSNAPLTERIQLSFLTPVGTTESFAGEMATVSGWGRRCDDRDNPDCGTSDILRYMENVIMTNTHCAAIFRSGIVVDSTICIQTLGRRGPCSGDSGSPYTVGRFGGRWQIAVHSFGTSGGCETEGPRAGARVTSFRTWIDSNMS